MFGYCYSYFTAEACSAPPPKKNRLGGLGGPQNGVKEEEKGKTEGRQRRVVVARKERKGKSEGRNGKKIDRKWE